MASIGPLPTHVKRGKERKRTLPLDRSNQAFRVLRLLADLEIILGCSTVEAEEGFALKAVAHGLIIVACLAVCLWGR